MICFDPVFGESSFDVDSDSRVNLVVVSMPAHSKSCTDGRGPSPRSVPTSRRMRCTARLFLLVHLLDIDPRDDGMTKPC